MTATWYTLRSEGRTFEMRVLVVGGRIAANNWHVSVTGDLWAEFRKEKEDSGWKVAPLYCGPRVI
jgi:hypothetical protein